MENKEIICHVVFNSNFSTPILLLWVACWRALFSYLDNKSLLLGITVAAVAFFLFFFVAFLFISTVHPLKKSLNKSANFPTEDNPVFIWKLRLQQSFRCVLNYSTEQNNETDSYIRVRHVWKKYQYLHFRIVFEI